MSIKFKSRAIFSESDSRIANVRPSVRLSVRPSVTETPQPLRNAPINFHLNQLSSQSTLAHPFATFKTFGLV